MVVAIDPRSLLLGCTVINRLLQLGFEPTGYAGITNRGPNKPLPPNDLRAVASRGLRGVERVVGVEYCAAPVGA
jgi:hypothetical protein